MKTAYEIIDDKFGKGALNQQLYDKIIDCMSEYGMSIIKSYGITSPNNPYRKLSDAEQTAITNSLKNI